MKQVSLKRLAAVGAALAIGLSVATAVPTHAANTIAVPTSPVSQTVATAPQVGNPGWYQVGDLSIRVQYPTPFQGTLFNQFNDADFYVIVGIVNEGSSVAQVNSNLDFELVDTLGTGHSPSICAGCPNQWGEAGSQSVMPGGSAVGTVFFHMSGRTPTGLLFTPTLGTQSTFIPLS